MAELFDELAALAPAERELRLAGLAGEPELVAELRALLAAHEGERPLAIEARLAEASGAGLVRGAKLGPYELVEPLGRGGMGEVWLAEQELGGVRRRVAIKRIRRGLESDELRRRFRVEGAALSRLSHRSIARLLDAGVDAEGIPYLVLEHVDGRPVTAACDERRLDLDRHTIEEIRSAVLDADILELEQCHEGAECWCAAAKNQRSRSGGADSSHEQPNYRLALPSFS